MELFKKMLLVAVLGLSFGNVIAMQKCGTKRKHEDSKQFDAFDRETGKRFRTVNYNGKVVLEDEESVSGYSYLEFPEDSKIEANNNGDGCLTEAITYPVINGTRDYTEIKALFDALNLSEKEEQSAGATVSINVPLPADGLSEFLKLNPAKRDFLSKMLEKELERVSDANKKLVVFISNENCKRASLNKKAKTSQTVEKPAMQNKKQKKSSAKTSLDTKDKKLEKDMNLPKVFDLKEEKIVNVVPQTQDLVKGDSFVTKVKNNTLPEKSSVKEEKIVNVVPQTQDLVKGDSFVTKVKNNTLPVIAGVVGSSFVGQAGYACLTEGLDPVLSQTTPYALGAQAMFGLALTLASNNKTRSAISSVCAKARTALAGLVTYTAEQQEKQENVNPANK